MSVAENVASAKSARQPLSSRLSANEVKSFVDRESLRRQSNKVLHGHPSPMYWKPLSDSVESLLEKRNGFAQQQDFSVNLYVGTPFCLKTKPARCGFCLFPSEDYRGNAGVEDYIDVLEKEFKFYKPYYAKDTLSSIYFGGGTPNLYHAEHYGRLMSFVDGLYGGVPDDIEITLEGIPQLFNEEKLRAIKNAGFNRISMGVQQLNEKLVKYSGRKQNNEQVFQALEISQKLDLASSIDLIYGWPEQTMDDMLNDLKIAVQAGVHHLTHYELNVAGRSDFASRQKRALLPSIQTNIEMYHRANDYLRSQGFEQVTVYDWKKVKTSPVAERLGRYDYEHNMHHFVEHDEGVVNNTQQICGIGFAAVNFHANGAGVQDENWSYMNHTSLDKYAAKVKEGKFPVDRGFRYEHSDVKLAWLFQSMQTMKINHVDYGNIFHENLLLEYGAVWEELENRQWIRLSETHVEFVGDGQYYIPMIQALVAKNRLAELRAASKDKLDSIAVTIE